MSRSSSAQQIGSAAESLVQAITEGHGAWIARQQDNSIMHLRNDKFKQSAYSLSDNEVYGIATKFLWLAYFLKDYVLFYWHRNE